MFFSKTKILSFALIAFGILFVQIFDITPVDSLDQRELIQSSNVVAQSINNGLAPAQPYSDNLESEQNVGLLWEITEKFETVLQGETPSHQVRISPKPTKDASQAQLDLASDVPQETSLTNDPLKRKYYRVDLGDTSSRIATIAGIDVDMLRMINHIGEGESIFEGQMLFIPSKQDLNISLTEELHWPFEFEELPFVVSQHYKVGHQGIDFDLPNKSPIRASASGLVTFAGWDPVGYGNMVLIYHGDEVFTLYAHLDSIKVSIGDSVRQASVIGYAGNTGFSSDTHLHFEILHRFTSLNPCFSIPYGCYLEK